MFRADIEKYQNFLFENFHFLIVKCSVYFNRRVFVMRISELCRLKPNFVKIDHEIFSTVILSHPLIQEGQLSVSGERMCTILVNRLED